MGDRHEVRFGEISVYLHWGTNNEELAEFLSDVQMNNGRDTRFDDPSYLSARFVKWWTDAHWPEYDGQKYGLGIGIIPFGSSDAYKVWTLDGGIIKEQLV